MRSAGPAPARLPELLQVSGIGERKAELYGRPILDALRRFRERRPGRCGAGEKA